MGGQPPVESQKDVSKISMNCNCAMCCCQKEFPDLQSFSALDQTPSLQNGVGNADLRRLDELRSFSVTGDVTSRFGWDDSQIKVVENVAVRLDVPQPAPIQDYQDL